MGQAEINITQTLDFLNHRYFVCRNQWKM